MLDILKSYIFAGGFFLCAVIIFTYKKEEKIKKEHLEFKRRLK